MFRCAQHDGCSGSSQRSERQTKCSQESVYVYFYTDSSSIFRSPQNDNVVFALNHFLSGTHSSARPGRLRGSHLRCEPAPGARSQTLKHYLPIVRKLRGRLEYATGGNAGGKEKRCSGRPRLTELNTGFSRASRSPALRRLAKLAPLASAREYFLYHY